MNEQVENLETAAVAAHNRGDTWTMFWEQHGAEVCRAEPHDRERFALLVRRLLAIVTSGDDDGLHPIGDDDGLPGEADEQPTPSDTRTQARCLLPMKAFTGKKTNA